MFDINKVISKLEEREFDAFINEMHFEIEFAKVIPLVYPNVSDIAFEYPFSRKRIDLVFRVDDEKFGIEFKYFTKKTERLSADIGISIELKNHVAGDLCRIGYWKDIEKLENALSNKKIDEGYAILLTNEQSIFNKLKEDACDYQFDISKGSKTPSIKEYYSKSKNKLMYKADIGKRYLFKINKFKKMFLMVNKIGGSVL